MKARAVLDAVRHYTPASIAVAVVDAIPRDEHRTWLEPCVGGGVFLDAIAAHSVPRHKITALDLDPRPKTMSRLAQVHSGKDFVAWASATAERYDNIVGNPPYITLERVPSRLRRAAYGLDHPTLGAVPRGSNYWLAFLYASALLLRDGGALGFVLPASYEYADYADRWRKWVRQNFRDSLTLRSKERVFSEVQDGSIVLLATGYKQPVAEHRVVRCDLATEIPSILSSTKSGDPKRSAVRLTSHYAVVPWSDMFELRIGAVTGDNSSFVLTEARRLELRLPEGACLPVVTRARHIRMAAIDRREWEELRSTGEPVWLFRPRASQLRDKAVSAYVKSLDTPKKNFKVTARKCWHEVDLPHRPQGFVSGMAIHGPWVCLNRVHGLYATNTLYTVRFKMAATLDERARDALSLLTSFVRRQLQDVARLYPDGLLKMEPRDLRSLVVPISTKAAGAFDAYEHALASITAGNERKAIKLADAWFEKK